MSSNTKNLEPLQPDTQVSVALERWPMLIPVFIRHRMTCVGCSMSPFETLASAAEIYHLPLDIFLTELRATLPDHPSPSAPAE